MSIIWLSIFFLLSFELTLVLLLCLPLPKLVRKRLAAGLSRANVEENFRFASSFIMAGLGLALAESINVRFGTVLISREGGKWLSMSTEAGESVADFLPLLPYLVR